MPLIPSARVRASRANKIALIATITSPSVCRTYGRNRNSSVGRTSALTTSNTAASQSTRPGSVAAELLEQAWAPDAKRDTEQVLVRVNEFRRLLGVQRRWIRNQRKVIDFDHDGTVTAKPV